MTRNKCKPKTYEAKHNGKTVRVIVPDRTAPDVLDEKVFWEGLRDRLSPEAFATIVFFLQPAHTSVPRVDREVEWFSGKLVELLGGHEQQSRLAEELGL
jgi:hypothetical protein